MYINKLKYSTLFVIFLISSCGGGKEMLEINLNCDENSNAGNAVVITIYQLKTDKVFSLSDFKALSKNPEETLRTDLVKLEEKTMIPGEQLKIESYEIIEGVIYLGVIADFYSRPPNGWQQLVPLSEDINSLTINIHENSISFRLND